MTPPPLRAAAGEPLQTETDMFAYIVRRLIWVVFLLFAITLITFLIFSVLPAGDPAVLRAGRQPSPELVESIRASLGLDKSKPEQFVNYIGDILPFVGGDGINFGFSYQNNADVLPGILERLPATIVLATGAVILWLLIGIPIGMLSAVKTGSVWDRLAMGLALIAISAPVYFLGLVVLYLFADDIGKFKILPGNSPTRTRTACRRSSRRCCCRGRCWRPPSPRSMRASCAAT